MTISPKELSYERPRKGIVPESRNNPSSYWVFQDIRCNSLETFFFPQNMVIITGMPQIFSTMLLEPKAGFLFEKGDKSLKIRIVILSNDQEVEMIGHKAIGQDLKFL